MLDSSSDSRIKKRMHVVCVVRSLGAYDPHYTHVLRTLVCCLCVYVFVSALPKRTFQSLCGSTSVLSE
jgi:hypothetical protein